MEFIKNGIAAYAGLTDVAGGKMWHCISGDGNGTLYFSYKRECTKYIKDNFKGEDRKFLISQLNRHNGRAVIYK